MICPNCQAPIAHVNVEPIPIQFGLKPFRGVAYTCPECSAILSVQPDPGAVQNALLQALAQAPRPS